VHKEDVARAWNVRCVLSTSPAPPSSCCPTRTASSLQLGRILVAIDDGSIAGHAQIISSELPDERELKSLAVAEHSQRRVIQRDRQSKRTNARRLPSPKSLISA
jgi:hypothetical protein